MGTEGNGWFGGFNCEVNTMSGGRSVNSPVLQSANHLTLAPDPLELVLSPWLRCA
jgi:hypothetical protein